MKVKPSLGALYLAFAYCVISACSNQKTTPPTSAAKSPLHGSITVNNNQDAQRRNAPIYIPFKDLSLKPEDVAGLVMATGSQTLAFETIDRDGDGNKDGLFALADIGPKQTQVWQLKKGGDKPAKPTKRTQAEISIKEGGQWVPHPFAAGKQAYQGGTFKNVASVTLPEFYTHHSNWIRYEGPGIESDQVAYRIYLDNRNGFDIFGKTLSEPVLQRIGHDGYEAYHKMLDWGLDILKVGPSLGTGGFGFWNGKNLILVADTQSRRARIIENGDVYSSFAIDYGQWLVDGNRRDLNAVFSMHGGSRLVHTRITMDKTLPNLAIGVVKHAKTEFLQGNSKNTYSYIGSWGKQSENGDHLGMAVIFKTKQFQKTVDDATSYVALMQPEIEAERSGLEYYFVAAWQGELGNGINSKQEFVAYLEDEIQKLSQPLNITVAQRASH
ncbi:MAG: hypothetical protein RL497_416 [Pseudomonadota bacterium]|jgi:hypothetical protein